jgi:hypothetical protein
LKSWTVVLGGEFWLMSDLGTDTATAKFLNEMKSMVSLTKTWTGSVSRSPKVTGVTVSMQLSRNFDESILSIPLTLFTASIVLVSLSCLALSEQIEIQLIQPPNKIKGKASAAIC